MGEFSDTGWKQDITIEAILCSSNLANALVFWFYSSHSWSRLDKIA